MKTKAEYLRDLFAVYCNIYKIRFDEVSVYSRGGHWYGQVRIKEGHNDYDTRLVSEWLFEYTDNGKEAQFGAKIIKQYKL
jgi:hypothetical protein